MEFQFWEQIYTEILEDFGFSRVRDEEAALLLSELLKDKKRSLDEAAQRYEACLQRIECAALKYYLVPSDS